MVVGDVLRGRLYGRGRIEYANKSVLEKRFDGEPAFRALMRNVRTGEEKVQYALYVCANGVWHSLITGEGLRFEMPADDPHSSVVTVPLVMSATRGDIAEYGVPDNPVVRDFLAGLPYRYARNGANGHRSRVYMSGTRFERAEESDKSHAASA